MKRQLIAFGLVVLSWGVQTPGAIAQGNMSNAQLNTKIRQALCLQDWASAIQAIDQMKKVTSAYRQELNYYRARLVLMRDQRTRIPSWPDAEYCAGNSPGIFPGNEASTTSQNQQSIVLPDAPPTAPLSVPVPADGSVTPEALIGIWYGEVECQFSNPQLSSETMKFKYQYTSEYQTNDQVVDRGYYVFDLNMQEGNMKFAFRVASSGSYQLRGNQLSEIATNVSAVVDQIAINNIVPTAEEKTLFEQGFEQSIREEFLNVPYDYMVNFNADNEIVLNAGESTRECNVSPMRRVSNQLF